MKTILFFLLISAIQLHSAVSVILAGEASGAHSATRAVTITSGIAAGHTAFAFFWWEANANQTPSIASTGGDTWTLHTPTCSGQFMCWVAGAAYMTTGITASGTVTLTTTTAGFIHGIVYDLGGDALTSSPVDATQQQANSNVTSHGTGTTATLAQANEVVFSYFVATGTFSAYGATYTGLISTSDGSNGRTGILQWKEVSATTAVSGSFTTTANAGSIGGIMTLKKASASPTRKKAVLG